MVPVIWEHTTRPSITILILHDSMLTKKDLPEALTLQIVTYRMMRIQVHHRRFIITLRRIRERIMKTIHLTDRTVSRTGPVDSNRVIHHIRQRFNQQTATCVHMVVPRPNNHTGPILLDARLTTVCPSWPMSVKNVQLDKPKNLSGWRISNIVKSNQPVETRNNLWSLVGRHCLFCFVKCNTYCMEIFYHWSYKHSSFVYSLALAPISLLFQRFFHSCPHSYRFFHSCPHVHTLSCHIDRKLIFLSLTFISVKNL